LQPDQPEAGAFEQALAQVTWKEVAALKDRYQEKINKIDDPDEVERVEGFIELLTLLLRKKRDGFHMGAAIRRIADLRRGYEYLQDSGLEVSDQIKQLLEGIFNRIQAAADQKNRQMQDHVEESAAQHGEQNEAQEIRDSLLIDAVHKGGRSHIKTSLSVEFAKKRLMSSGFQSVPDARLQGSVRVGREVEDSFGATALDYMLQEQGIQLSVTAVPVTRQVPVFKTPPAPTGFFAKMLAGAPQPQQVGTREEPVPLAQFTQENGGRGTERAYRISVIIRGTDLDKHIYRDPSTKRGANQIWAAIYVPKKQAEKVLARIRQDPLFVLPLLRRFDPELMEEQEQFIPPIERAFVLPMGEAAHAYKKDRFGKSTEILPSNIVPVH